MPLSVLEGHLRIARHFSGGIVTTKMIRPVRDG